MGLVKLAWQLGQVPPKPVVGNRAANGFHQFRGSYHVSDFMALFPQFGKQPRETIGAHLLQSASAALD
jgi:hypothetical protein